MDTFIGQIMPFSGAFAPKGWLFCNGALLPVDKYAALFSVIGTYYGGNGSKTFGLPDLRGRMPIGAGQGIGLTPINMGQAGGKEHTSLGVQDIPSHNHQVTASLRFRKDQPNTNDPYNATLSAADADIYQAAGPTEGSRMHPDTIKGTSSVTGSGTPFNTHQPFQVVNYIIAYEGTFPSRT